MCRWHTAPLLAGIKIAVGKDGDYEALTKYPFMCAKTHSNKEKADSGTAYLYGIPVIAYNRICMHSISACNDCSGGLEIEGADCIFWEVWKYKFQ